MSDRFLSTPLRRALERTIKEARAVAEQAAADAIRRLGVADAKSPTYLDQAEQELRRRLRAHGRALGDRKVDDTQTTDRLIEATAYEHWHRRLFARFLAERHLLRHPEHDVLVTLEDCKEFAAEDGLADEWAAAEAYASKMLPAVFRPEDPVLELEFSPEHELKLRQLVVGIDAETFQADDALGWTYQFWRALEKDRVNKAGGKIGAAELPAVTQLFTEPYMVRFLLHNTLGAWWAGKVLATRPELASEAPDEATLRAAISPPGYEFDMLRFVREATDAPRWRPAAGTYSGWPTQTKALRVLDPCCGSGHFLTEALTILAALRASEEGLTLAASVSAVLRDNLHGLELDGRCVQIAAFAVALTAWKVGGFQVLTAPHVAWVGAPPPLPKKDFEDLGNGDADLRRGLGILHGLFLRAPILGSLLDPDRGDFGDAHGALDFAPMLEKLIEKARRAERIDAEAHEGVIAARGMADAAAILRTRYDLVATNVPFLGRGKQDATLLDYIARTDPDAKADLATAMFSRALRMLSRGGTVAAVTPESWLFLGGFKDLRARLLSTATANVVAVIGEHGFESAAAAGAFTGLFIFTAAKPSDDSTFAALSAHAGATPSDKARMLAEGGIGSRSIATQRRSADSIISIEDSGTGHLLQEYAQCYAGTQSGDYPRCGRAFWERLDYSVDTGWVLAQGPPDGASWISGLTHALNWRAIESGETGSAYVRGVKAWGNRGVIFGQMRSLHCGGYWGARYIDSSLALVPHDEVNLGAITAYAESGELAAAVRKINRKNSVNNGYFGKVQFDLEHWKAVASEKYPAGLPEPYCDDPTQWLFHGHPAGAAAGTQLHVVLARLAGYRWPAEEKAELRVSAETREWIAGARTLPLADADGLLMFPAAGGDRPLVDRLRDFLAICFGADWNEGLERRLVAEADELIDRSTARDGSLEAWLRDRAFRQHCKLFQERPFLLHVWDGQKDGFSAFVHYHRLDRTTLQKLTYTVLGDWIARRKAEGDDRRVEAASILQSKLAAILEGEAPYDIFVRWKPLERQPLGWDPDLDDGVRLNIRPWVQAGVLRETPKIKWGVDRGTDPTSAPWYELFQGKRNNDHHTTLAEKRAARAAKSATAA